MFYYLLLVNDMNVEHLQVENGNFTRIVNPLIEELVKMPFKGCELAITLYIIRKTYGYQKKQDEISISQFEEKLQRGRPTIVKALKNLQLVNIVKLVKVGNMKGRGSVWTINKYTDTWGVVNTCSLVKRNNVPSLHVYTKPSKDVLTHKRKKEITKEIANGNPNGLQGTQWNELIDSFKEINPSYLDFYKNRTERKALELMATQWGYDKLLRTIKHLPQIIGQPYAPKITKPTELRRDIGKLLAYVSQEKSKNNIKVIL